MDCRDRVCHDMVKFLCELWSEQNLPSSATPAFPQILLARWILLSGLNAWETLIDKNKTSLVQRGKGNNAQHSVSLGAHVASDTLAPYTFEQASLPNNQCEVSTTPMVAIGLGIVVRTCCDRYDVFSLT